MERGVSKNTILSELTKSTHGNLKEYLNIGKDAATQEAEFFAHLLAWNRLKGSIRDSKVALPVIALTNPKLHEDFVDNALANIALLGPRELEKAFRFALEVKIPGNMRKVRHLVRKYLQFWETNPRIWDRIALQHRETLRDLYALSHTNMSNRMRGVLFGEDRGSNKSNPKIKLPYPPGSVFEVVQQRLGSMSPVEAAAAIMQYKIPFLVAMGALGKKAKEPELVQALIERMSPTELVTNTKLLERLGMKNNPALRGAFEKAMESASKSTKNVLKTTRAAEAIKDETLKEKLRGLQERQLKTLGGVDGNWLVLADKSGSMEVAIDTARQVAATLSKMVKGNVYLVFFDVSPRFIDVTGMALDKINEVTKHVIAQGGTSIGCGLQAIMDKKIEVDGIAIVSDAGENSDPKFPNVYKKYSALIGKEIPVYLYFCAGREAPHLIQSMKAAEIPMEVFDLRYGVDYYSLPNLVQSMRVCRYSLIDEVMEVPLLHLADVFKSEGREVKTSVA